MFIHRHILLNVITAFKLDKEINTVNELRRKCNYVLKHNPFYLISKENFETIVQDFIKSENFENSVLNNNLYKALFIKTFSELSEHTNFKKDVLVNLMLLFLIKIQKEENNELKRNFLKTLLIESQENDENNEKSLNLEEINSKIVNLLQSFMIMTFSLILEQSLLPLNEEELEYFYVEKGEVRGFSLNNIEEYLKKKNNLIHNEISKEKFEEICVPFIFEPVKGKFFY